MGASLLSPPVGDVSRGQLTPEQYEILFGEPPPASPEDDARARDTAAKQAAPVAPVSVAPIEPVRIGPAETARQKPNEAVGVDQPIAKPKPSTGPVRPSTGRVTIDYADPLPRQANPRRPKLHKRHLAIPAVLLLGLSLIFAFITSVRGGDNIETEVAGQVSLNDVIFPATASDAETADGVVEDDTALSAPSSNSDVDRDDATGVGPVIEIVRCDVATEEVELVNSGDMATTLVGWRLHDEGRVWRTGLDAVSLDAGERIVLLSGDDTVDFPGSFRWSDGNVWNNRGGDTATLIRSDGAVVANFLCE